MAVHVLRRGPVVPAYLKSIAASIALTAFLFGHKPDAQIICVSYAQELHEACKRHAACDVGTRARSPCRCGSNAIPGWTVTGVSVDYVVAPYWQASDGIASLDLNGTTLVDGSYLGGVSQTFPPQRNLVIS